MSTASTTWVLIPIKARGQGKTRLAGVLSEQDRDRLVDTMLAHVVAVAGGVVTRVMLVGHERTGLGAGLDWIEDAGGGLNAALDHAFAQVAGRADAPDRVIVLPADLPCLAADEIERLARVPPGEVGIAPDRHGRGTNALSLPLPAAAGFAFHYGIDSAARHCEQTQLLGLNAVTITGPGLEKDIDEPSDLADAGHLFSLST